ncbi:MAG: hypothetical protein HKN19_13355 [Halioglobus sp.]|nr:hypothetical protein [Halioglobus sp.]
MPDTFCHLFRACALEFLYAVFTLADGRCRLTGMAILHGISRREMADLTVQGGGTLYLIKRSAAQLNNNIMRCVVFVGVQPKPIFQQKGDYTQ